jgi:hypothetical protein
MSEDQRTLVDGPHIFPAHLPQFVYKPLHDPTKEIRLLRIHTLDRGASGGASDINIEVTLEHLQRSANPTYDALSYTWGSGSLSWPILVNGSRFNATENLAIALGQLHGYKDRDRYRRSELIWIDALCINQNDDHEKSVQVHMMGSIFSEAVQVIVSLGHPSDEISSGLRSMEHLARVCRHLRHSGLDESTLEIQEYVTSYLRSFVRWDTNIGRKGTANITAVCRLSWWHRVWVIQEIALARQAWIISEKGAIDMEHLRHLNSIINELRKIPESTIAPGYSRFISSLRGSMFYLNNVLGYWESAEMELCRVLGFLFVTMTTEATDPRDRIYALEALCNDFHEVVGTIDYSISWQQLYTRIAKSFIRKYGVNVLSFCGPLAQRHKTGLPSWAPDWSQRTNTPLNPARPLDPARTSFFYAASGSASQLFDDNTFASTDFVVEGVVVSTIKEVADPWLKPVLEASHLRARLISAKLWCNNIDRLALSLNLPNHDHEDMVLRTISADVRRVSDKIDACRLEDPDLIDCRAHFVAMKSLPTHDLPLSRDDLFKMLPGLSQFVFDIRVVTEDRRPFISANDILGIAPAAAEVGDVVCILLGANVPFVLRAESGGRYRLLGEAYVHGIMDGQFLETNPPIEKFTLC